MPQLSKLAQAKGPQPLGHANYAAWTPDMSDRTSGTEALGCVSREGQYAPIYSPILLNGNLAAAANQARGAGGFYDSSGSVNVFFGDSANLYRLVGNAAVNVSGATYALGTGDTWQFAQFGNDIIAVTPTAPVSVFTLHSSSVFAPLGRSPPGDCRCVARIGDFVFVGYGNTVAWSGFNNDLIWGTNPAYQSDSQVFDNLAGRVQAIFGGYPTGVIFFENAIRVANYAGPPVIWDFGQDFIEVRRGLIAPNAAIKVGNLIYYASDQGFYTFDGLQAIPIGQDKVDNYFLSNLNYGSRDAIFSGYDSTTKAVYWGYPAGSNMIASELLILSLVDGQWSHDFGNYELIFEMPRPGFTVDNIYPGYFSVNNLDTAGENISIDADLFRDSRRQLAAFDTSHRANVFSGPPRPVTLTTTEVELAPGQRCFVSELWPIGDAVNADVSAAIGYRPAPGGPITYTPYSAMNGAGFCPQRIDSRFVRASVQIAAGAGWKRQEGVHFRGRPSGWR